MSSYKNAILDALGAADAEFVRDRVKPVSFVQGDLLLRAGDPIEHVYFPQSGMISVVVELDGGGHIEAAMIGRDGALGAGAGCGVGIAINSGFAQMGGQGWRMAAADVAAVASQHRPIHLMLAQHEQFLMAQAQQMAACGARHHIPARLCTWLLRARDLSASDDMPVTQEFVARGLGVQRASISLIAGSLQEAGLIQYRRGRLSIVDRDGLANRACECYQALRGHYHRLFQPERATAATS